MRLIHRTARHPTITHLPDDAREHVEQTMRQMVRQQVLSDTFAHVTTTQDGGTFRAEIGVVTPYQFNRAQLLARQILDTDPRDGAALDLARLVLGLPDEQITGWNGQGTRPVIQHESGLIEFALAPYEIEPVGENGWRTRGEVAVRYPDGVTRITDVAVQLPNGQVVKPTVCRARPAGMQSMMTVEGLL
ncbi:hypothetical protein DM785_02585 [Deinococcus actinosclerus]|nr:hypothetical protein DM785_02585 [Deinococcus actinosclerus]